MSKLKDEQALFEKILPDVVLVENLQQEIDRLSAKISTLKHQLEQNSSSKFSTSNRTAEEIRRLYENLQVSYGYLIS